MRGRRHGAPQTPISQLCDAAAHAQASQEGRASRQPSEPPEYDAGAMTSIQVREVEAFASVHDMIHAAIQTQGERAGLREIYRCCAERGRIAYKRSGASRLITSSDHWKSQIRHALYTSDRFVRAADAPDSWVVAAAYADAEPQLVRVLVRADGVDGFPTPPPPAGRAPLPATRQQRACAKRGAGGAVRAGGKRLRGAGGSDLMDGPSAGLSRNGHSGLLHSPLHTAGTAPGSGALGHPNCSGSAEEDESSRNDILESPHAVGISYGVAEQLAPQHSSSPEPRQRRRAVQSVVCLDAHAIVAAGEAVQKPEVWTTGSSRGPRGAVPASPSDGSDISAAVLLSPQEQRFLAGSRTPSIEPDSARLLLHGSPQHGQLGQRRSERMGAAASAFPAAAVDQATDGQCGAAAAAPTLDARQAAWARIAHCAAGLSTQGQPSDWNGLSQAAISASIQNAMSQLLTAAAALPAEQLSASDPELADAAQLAAAEELSEADQLNLGTVLRSRRVVDPALPLARSLDNFNGNQAAHTAVRRL